MKNLQKFIENIIFNARWVLIPFYLGLIIVLFIYTYIYGKEVFHLITEINKLDKDKIMLIILEIVDIVMIANLVKMIITGSYNSFVSKNHDYKNENVSSGMLKVKMSTSIAGVSSIHLLRSFIDAKNIEWSEINKQMAIHGIILVGSLILAYIDFLHIQGERIEHSYEKAIH